MISIILLSLAIVLLIFTDAMLFKKVVDLEELVDSRWDKIRRETNMIRCDINGEDYYDTVYYREDGE